MIDYGLFLPFYNNTSIKCLLKTGRQIGKTTSLAVKQLMKAVAKAYTELLTLLPLASQTKRFSRLYVDAIIRGSPVLGQRIDSSLSNTINLKEFNNGSNLHYWYAGENVDRTRSISVKEIYWDEIQDIIWNNIYAAEQCTSSVDKPQFSYSGTPKTVDNTIEALWQKSSQCEPVITCSRCNFENFCFIPGVYKMLQKAGLSCQKCGKLLDMRDVYGYVYIPFDKSKVGIFDGYHIPQIFAPRNLSTGRWNKIMLDYEDYSEFEFATEVLGISFDSGGRPITLEELKSCCTDREFGHARPGEHIKYIMGVDWGYATPRSYTVMCILGVRPIGDYEVIFAKKFKYRNRIDQRKELLTYFKQYGCEAMGVDHGVGLTDNLELRAATDPSKVYEYHYCGSHNKKILNFLPEHLMFATDRTRTLSLMFNDMINKKILYPKYEDIKPFFDDILSIYEGVREGPTGKNKYYDRNPKLPDDFAHALNYALITAKLLTKGTILDTIIEHSSTLN